MQFKEDENGLRVFFVFLCKLCVKNMSINGKF